MSDVNRRSFLKLSWLPQSPATTVEMRSFAVLIPEKKEDQSSQVWIDVGNFADFPPGSSRFFRGQNESVGEYQVIVLSLPEGLCAVKSEDLQEGREEQRLPVKLQRSGKISICINGEWPRNTVLSVMTGEPVLM